VKDKRLPFSYRALAIGLAVVAFLGDAWLASLRCSLSPQVDWSRLAFGLVVQVLAVVSALVANRTIDHEARWADVRVGAFCLAAILISLVMVRQAYLLSDTVIDKFRHSSGYECPGVRLG
jgi:hypothetical protein